MKEQQLTIPELQDLIIVWAKQKNINNPEKQYLKILEETGETARAILKNDIPEIKDGIGDIAVTVIIYYWQKGKYLDPKVWTYEKDNNEEQTRLVFGDILNSIYDLDSDVLDALEMLAIDNNTDLHECLNLAWQEIKDRQGKTINGTFVKN